MALVLELDDLRQAHAPLVADQLLVAVEGEVRDQVRGRLDAPLGLERPLGRLAGLVLGDLGPAALDVVAELRFREPALIG